MTKVSQNVILNNLYIHRYISLYSLFRNFQPFPPWPLVLLEINLRTCSWDRKCLDLRGTRTPNLWIHAECSNHLSYQGQTFAVPCFEHWLWWYRYFLGKVYIWYVNCARATAFIFDTRTDVLVKVSKFLRQKMSRPERDSNPQPSDSCRML